MNEQPRDKTNKMAYAPSEDSNQPGHPPSLIRVFAARMKKAWVLSYPLSAQRRLIRLGSFQCRGVLLLWHMIGQGPAVLAAGAGRVGCFFFLFYFFISSILSSFSNASSLGRRLDILKYCGLGRYNATVVVSYYWRRAH